MAKAMLPPGPNKLLQDLEYEVTSEGEVISLGIKLKDDCHNIQLIILLTALEMIYNKTHQYLHLALELNNDLNTLFEEKSLQSVFTDGALAFAHLKTNSASLIQTLFE